MRNITQAMERDDVVRLRGWRWIGASPPTPEAVDRLAQAWRREAEQSLRPGVVYRELCQPLSVGTDAQPIDRVEDPGFLLVEFAVIVPELARTERLDSAAEFTPDLEETAGFFRIDFRVAPTTVEATGLIFFDFFDLPGPPGPRQGFLMGWPARLQNGGPGGGAVLCERLISEHRFHAFERREAHAGADPRGGANADDRGRPYRIVAAVGHERRPPRPTMKAARFHAFGGPPVLTYEDASRPRPGPGQVLVRLRSAAVNRLDGAMRSGAVRGNFPPWFPDTPGHAFAGTVVELGDGAAGRQVGEEVYGATTPILRRAYAQYIVVSDNVIHPKPRNFSFDEAAGCVSVVTTAWAALFGRRPLLSGQRILVHGGAGAVGIYAIQLAKQLGAEVITTASQQNAERLKALGADLVIDYRTERFEALAGEVDFVLDSQGGDTRERSWPLLKRGGVLASLQRPAPDERRAAELGLHGFVVFGHPDIGAVLPEITRRLEAGELSRPVISRTFPLEQAASAHALMEASASSERLVLQID